MSAAYNATGWPQDRRTRASRARSPGNLKPVGHQADAAWDSDGTDRQTRALDEALTAAEAIGQEFAQRWRSNPLSPTVGVDRRLGSRDQPLFVLTIALDLEEDFDDDAWRDGQVEKMVEDLRSLVLNNSTVNDWDWLVTTAVRAGSPSG